MLRLTRVMSAACFPKEPARIILTDTDVFWLKPESPNGGVGGVVDKQHILALLPLTLRVREE